MGNRQKVDKNNIEDIIALSPIQEGMLFHYLHNPDSREYFEQLSLSLSGEINEELLTKAWNWVAKNNEMLRTVFRWDKLDSPLQIILKEFEIPIKKYDLSYEIYDEAEAIEQIKHIREKDKIEGIDLAREPFRVILIKLSETLYEMIISSHHILYDGWSNGIILREFFEALNNFCSGKELKRTKKSSYKEFIKWYERQDREEQRRYWTDYLKGISETMQASTGFRDLKSGEQLETFLLELSDEKMNEINLFCSKNKITSASFFYTAWGIVLQKHNNSEDAIFGTTISGRAARIDNIEAMVGLFINTLPLRVTTGEKDRITDLLKATEDTLRFRTGELESTPLLDIKEYSGISAAEELFDSIIVVENYPLGKEWLGESSNIAINSYEMHEATNYSLTITINTLEKIEIKFIYDRTRYDKDKIEQLSCHYYNAMVQMLESPNKHLSEVCLLSDEEKHKLLYEFNNTYTEYPQNRAIHELYEEQARKTPDDVAVVYGDKQMTYRELNGRANQLARILREKGVDQNCIVGIMVEKSLEMIVGIMGILKAGGAYLPLDMEYPTERIKYMVQNSSTKVILTQEKYNKEIEFEGISLIDIDKALNNCGLSEENLDLKYDEDRTFYVIYTSGSTGRPKGAACKSNSFTNLINWYTREFKIGQEDTILLAASVSFDLAQKNLYASLVRGGKLCILPEKSLNQAPDLVKKHSITIINCTPSAFQMIVDSDIDQGFKSLKTLKHVFLGGEPINMPKLMSWICTPEYNAEIVNTYGPTECTDISTFYRIRDTEIRDISIVPIGKPIDNVKLYILDKYNNLTMIGQPGEIYVSGISLGKGYLNRPELTAEKFINNPFEPGVRMYKTGDMGRWLSDGNIEFLGRIDHQVKIRGFRIELGEIENQLLSNEHIKEAIVAAKEDDSGSKYLCAYMVAQKDLKVSELREYLGKVLPDYMIPSYFMQLDKMPLTPNGKIDRKALPKPDGRIESEVSYAAPENLIEEKLVKIWEEILKVKKIGINDNFFELGGHSLKAARLAAKLHKELNVEVPIREIFRTPTIKGLSRHIKGLEENIYASIKAINESGCNTQEYYPTSSAQKRLYTLQQLDIESTGYNMSEILVIEGELDVGRLHETLEKLKKRHEALRTSFKLVDEEIVQNIHKEVKSEIAYQEVKSDNELSTEEIKELTGGFIKAFDLSKAPLFRVGLIKVQSEKHIDKQTYILMFDTHHIISDGMSVGILIEEFVKLYEGIELSKLRIQYKDYAAWQNEMMRTDVLKQQEEYWLKKFEEEIPILNLPTDYPRPVMQSFEGNQVYFEADKEITDGLKRINKDTGTTMYMVLLAAFNILLSKYSGQEDIVIGSPIAGRPHAELENIIGMFVNTLAMRNYPEGSKTFKEFLEEIKLNALNAYENQDYQFEQLVERLNVRRDMSRNPIFDVMFVMQNTDIKEIAIEGLSFKQCRGDRKISKFDITLEAVEIGEKIELCIEYCTRLFSEETIRRMEGHLKNILKSIVQNADKRISEIEMLDEEERNKVIFEFNNTNTEYPKYKTIHQLFEEQVERIPDSAAVVYEDKQLTYSELNERANQLARQLREKGAGAGRIVGIMVEKSLEMLVGILGILKSGGAYLPVDPEYPRDRISYMLEDSGARILLTQKHLRSNIAFNGEIIELEDERLYEGETCNLDEANTSKDLAYIMYTSGSTGKPKGVMIEHKSVVRLVKNTNYIELNEKDRILQTGAIVFDAITFEIWGALLNGLSLYLVSKDKILDADKLKQEIEKNGITTLWLTSSLFNQIVDQNASTFEKCRNLLVGGDILSPKHISEIRNNSKEIRIINGYGPTENTTFTTCFTIEKTYDANIPIGRPISNTRIYILDQKNNLKPIGAAGEICIAGEGLARGYLNSADLTAEKFVENPYEPGERMYRTGDLGRWLFDGSIEFLGRIDHQVKIRGYRIELDEIVKQLQQHDAVKEAIVTAKEEQGGSKYLCAYIAGDRELTVGELRAHLLKVLPEYMIPSYFLQLESIPLTSNGKIDRKALPEPDGSIATGVKYAAPQNAIEEQLALIWQSVLSVEQVGINDSFFELGGHSLKAVKAANLIKQRLQVDINLKDIFEYNTIEELSKHISTYNAVEREEISKMPEQDYYPLSYNQKRLLILKKLNPNGTEYNICGQMRMNEAVDINSVRDAFKYLIQRHESLRTCIVKVDGISLQKLEDNIEFQVGLRDISMMHEGEKGAALEKIVREISTYIFNLEQAPMMISELIKLAENEYELVFCMHHIISDGWSLEIVKREFMMSYEAYKNGREPYLEPLTIQYKDFAYWQNKQIEDSEWMKQAIAYWKEQLEGDIYELDMPMKSTKKQITGKRGSSYRVVINEAVKEKLKEIAIKQKSSLFSSMLSAFYIYFAELTGQEDITFGIAGSGRDYAGLENIFGYFVNTIILRNKVNKDESYLRFLDRISGSILNALRYQDYPLELIISELKIKYPVINVFINMPNMFEHHGESLNDPLPRHLEDINDVKFDMEFYLIEYADGIEMVCTYAKDYFDPKVVEYMVNEYVSLLSRISEEPAKEVAEYFY